MDRIKQDGFETATYLEWYSVEPAVAENHFLTVEPEDGPLPTFDAVRGDLPQIHWPSNPVAERGYWKAWQLAFQNLRKPEPGSGFVSNFIDTAFNDCLFMWDSAFILQFGKYADRVFQFQKTLDNFYARQHPDGFICRELREKDGSDQWHRHVPFSTGPNVLAWAELDYFKNYCDIDRLQKVYPPLLAFHRWLQRNQTWQNGSYWTTGLGCGMDNMARTPEGFDNGKDHASMSWVDATCQAILSANSLAMMGRFLGRPESELEAFKSEANHLTDWVNANLWDPKQGFYCDGHADGSLSPVKHIGAFWALLAEVVPPENLETFLDHLNDPRSFRRHHRTPSLAADQPGYVGATGEYWLGGVWAPTTYMVLRGLTANGERELAYAIARNHLDRVLEVFETTGTFWENYAPEVSAPGKPAKADFVGWSGLTPISVLLEYVFGLRPLEGEGNRLIWDIQLTDAFGVDNYPLGPTNLVDLQCEARESKVEEPKVCVRAKEHIVLELRWQGGSKLIHSEPRD